MTIMVMDGQGGRMGKSVVEQIRKRFPEDEILAIGTNSIAIDNTNSPIVPYLSNTGQFGNSEYVCPKYCGGMNSRNNTIDSPASRNSSHSGDDRYDIIPVRKCTRLTGCSPREISTLICCKLPWHQRRSRAAKSIIDGGHSS